MEVISSDLTSEASLKEIDALVNTNQQSSVLTCMFGLLEFVLDDVSRALFVMRPCLREKLVRRLKIMQS